MDGKILDSSTQSEINELWIISETPVYIKRENTEVLLNGKWLTQSIGRRAEIRRINVAVTYATWKLMLDYADTKSFIDVWYREWKKRGFIKDIPRYDEAVPFDAAPYYYIEFDLAVMENV